MAKTLGQVIHFIRTVRQIDQAELAQKSGLSNQYISMLENDLRDPRFSSLTALAEALGVTRSFMMMLMEEEDEQVKLYLPVMLNHFWMET